MLRFILLSVVAIGFCGLFLRRNLIFKVLALDIVTTGVVSLFVYQASLSGRQPPIIRAAGSTSLHDYADPLPQAVILTAIVISFALLALLIVYIMDLSRECKTLEADCIEKKVQK